MKTIYIILTSPNSRPSKLIRWATNDMFSHSSIALVPSPHHLYSFGRRKVNNFLIGGFINEDTKKNIFALYPHARCDVYALDVCDDSYSKMEMLLNVFNRNYKRYKYNFSGILTTFLGIKTNLRYRYTCSQFVSTMLYLSKAANLPKHPSLMKPMDLTSIKGLRKIYSGEICRLSFDNSINKNTKKKENLTRKS